jgi:hypothetical protein
MSEEQPGGSAVVRVFGALHAHQKQHGRPSEFEVRLPAEGRPALEVALDLGLPTELIEAVFCNRVVYGLGHLLRPGDRVAFVPRGTPGPHRFTLGIHEAGKARRPEGAGS